MWNPTITDRWCWFYLIILLKSVEYAGSQFETEEFTEFTGIANAVNSFKWMKKL